MTSYPQSLFNEIQALLAQFDAFKQVRPEADLQAFGQYLAGQSAAPPEPLPDVPTGSTPEFDPVYRQFPAERKISVLMYWLSRFSKLYTKRALAGLPISSQDEFTYLVGLTPTYQPSKSELINSHFMEITSGSEIIRRLIQMNLVGEVADASDRRLKRLRITKAGEAVRLQAIERMTHTARLLVGRLSETDLDQLLRHLSALHEFHVHLYERESDQPLEQLVEKYLTDLPAQ